MQKPLNFFRACLASCAQLVAMLAGIVVLAVALVVVGIPMYVARWFEPPRHTPTLIEMLKRVAKEWDDRQEVASRVEQLDEATAGEQP